MRRKLVVAVAEIWLPLIGAGIFIAWAIGAWYGGNKYLSTWLIFGGVVCLLLLATIQWQRSILEEGQTGRQDDIGQKQTRAYVGVVGFHIVKFAVSQPIQAQIIFSNAGQTPAYNVKSRFSRMDIDEFPAPVYVPTPLPPDTETGGATIAPKGTHVVSPSRGKPLDQIELNALQPNTRVIGNAIYIQGVVTYRDAFKQLRITRFYGAYGGPYGINQTGAVAIMDGPGNESD